MYAERRSKNEERRKSKIKSGLTQSRRERRGILGKQLRTEVQKPLRSLFTILSPVASGEG